MLDSVRSIGSSLNPIGRLSSMGMMRGFGRSSTPTKDPSPATATADGGGAATSAAVPPPPRQVPVPKLAPPNRRFLELQTAADLKLGEVRDLLRDYRRLAAALKKMGAFDDQVR
ncbi:hypothetical protein E4U41_003491 [Claviceps citrina]|nr:hypothetical protein E4U41_003491 [Claviceps citrina]